MLFQILRFTECIFKRILNNDHTRSQVLVRGLFIARRKTQKSSKSVSLSRVSLKIEQNFPERTLVTDRGNVLLSMNGWRA